MVGKRWRQSSELLMPSSATFIKYIPKRQTQNPSFSELLIVVKTEQGWLPWNQSLGGRSLRTRINVLQPLCSLCFCDCSVLKGPPLAKGTQQKASANLSTPVTTQHPPPLPPPISEAKPLQSGTLGRRDKKQLVVLSFFVLFFFLLFLVASS